MSIGIDIVKIERIAHCKEKIANKILSHRELCLKQAKKEESISASFAVKEAFSKAMGTGFAGFDFKDIHVMRKTSGEPYLEFSDKLKKILEQRGFIKAHVSISHEKEYAIGMVTLDFDEKYALVKRAEMAFEEVSDENIITPDVIKKIIPKRDKNSHKGNFGRVFILAGSKGLTGAGILASRASLKSGSGLITLGCPQSLNTVFEIATPEVMTLPISDTDGIINENESEKILAFAKKSDKVLFGPGTGITDGTKIILKKLIEAQIPLVIDADGLNIISSNIDILRKHKSDIIITPHIGEFARLTGLDAEYIEQNKKDVALNFAKKYNVFVILKSHKTTIATPNGLCYTNILGNPGMASGGSGDVLAGVVLSLWGQGFSACNSCICGVYLHALSGDICAYSKGEYGMTPSDIIENLPYAIKYSGGVGF